jgi:hypothetical protein
MDGHGMEGDKVSQYVTDVFKGKVVFYILEVL